MAARNRNRKKKDTPARLFLQRELAKMMKNPTSEYFQIYGLINDDIQKWEVYIIGPPNTLYEKGVYKAIIEFPDEYPIKPPSMQFETDIFHPNIYKNGKVCISTLQTGSESADSAAYWRPVLGVEQAILSVISLLSDPNDEDPANAQASSLHKSDIKAFENRCRQLAEKSLKQLPDDFEYPQPINSTQAEEILEDEEKKAAEETVDNIEDVDDDEWEYDIEDLSSDDAGYEYDEEVEEVEEAEDDQSTNSTEKEALQHVYADDEVVEITEDPIDSGAPPPNTRNENDATVRRKSRRSSVFDALSKLTSPLKLRNSDK